MRNFEPMGVMRIISEPGDMTRYSYLICRDGPSEFTFAPIASTFRFPQRMDIFEARKIVAETPGQLTEDSKTCLKKAEEEQCNPNTVLECAKAIVQYLGKKANF